MERLGILAPAALLVGTFFALLAVYTILHLRGRLRPLGTFKSNDILGPFWGAFMVWLLRPVERAMIASRVTPTHITATSLVLCICAGFALGAGYLATGAWLFIAGGMLDIVDGRIARATNQQTTAGALFDSVADRWSELAIFAGLAWYLRDAGPWLLAVMITAGGSFMVSYTRARAEALGIQLRSGAMQRAERIVLISVGALVAAWFAAEDSTAPHAQDVMGLALAVCGLLSCATAIARWHAAHRALAQAVAVVPETARTAGEQLATHHGLEAVH